MVTWPDLVIGIAVIISLLIILLTMYTSVMERTRQIGILKSLGASRMYIIGIFIRESLVISVMGVAAGLAVSLLVRWLLVGGLGMRIDIDPGYTLLAISIGMISGVIGAIYPALRAAAQDPIRALGYE